MKTAVKTQPTPELCDIKKQGYWPSYRQKETCSGRVMCWPLVSNFQHMLVGQTNTRLLHYA